MCGSQIAALVDELAGAELATCDRVALARLVVKAQKAHSWLDAFDARAAQRVATLAQADAGDRPAAVLGGGGRRSGREAAAVERRAKALELLPQLGEALAAGEVSAGHVDAVTRTVADLDDAGRERLHELDAAVTDAAIGASSVEAFEKETRELSRLLSPDDGLDRHERRRRQRSLRRWTDRQTGMCHTHLELDPETDARVAAALDAAVTAERAADEASGQARTFDQLKADAAVALITGSRAVDPRVPEISVLIDLDTLRDRLHDDGVCETADANPVPPETVRRLACEATIIPIVLDGDGVPLDMGRACRVATREQRRVLRAMYQTCAYPGCGVRFGDCDIHHAVHWTRDGVTDLENLVPLCSVHHHLVHEGGWTLRLQPDRTVTVLRPDGSTAFEGRTTNQRSAAPTPQPTTVDDVRKAVADGLVQALARFERPPPDIPAA